MNHIDRLLRSPVQWLPALSLAFVAGCGGGSLDPILGTPGLGAAPTVTATSPANTSPIVTGVAANATASVTFSKPMTATTLTPTSFTLACPASAPVTATVAYDATSRTATLTPAAALPASTTCVATVTTSAQDSQGIPLAADHTWSFTTGAAPTVSATSPARTTPIVTGVATNSRVFATFSKPMTATTLTPSSVTLACPSGAPVTAAVSYDAASRTAALTPAAALPASTTCVATVTTAARDSQGFALASNHVWSFTTGAGADLTPPTVSAVGPADGATGVCLTRSVTATFDEPMDPVSINASTLTVTDNGAAVAGNVSYDATNRVATFTASNAAGFAANRTFVVTVESGSAGAKDVAGNALAVDRVFGFTTGTQPCVASVALQTAAAYGAFGGNAGVTNQGLNTVIGGNVGTTAACTLITGLHDATNSYTESTAPEARGLVSGSIVCGPPAPGTTTTLAAATQARADAQTAYNALAALPPGSDPGAGQLGGLVLAPRVYTSAGGTFNITSGNLTLDAQGDADAVWVFQSASALTVGLPATPRSVLLINGAQAKNVYWQVGSAARIEDGSTMAGTIIAPAGVTISTPGQLAQTTLTGRAIGLTASVTVVNTTIVAP